MTDRLFSSALAPLFLLAACVPVAVPVPAPAPAQPVAVVQQPPPPQATYQAQAVMAPAPQMTMTAEPAQGGMSVTATVPAPVVVVGGSPDAVQGGVVESPAPPPAPQYFDPSWPPPDCKQGEGGVKVCGYNCRLGSSGAWYCASRPDGECTLNSDGTFTCP